MLAARKHRDGLHDARPSASSRQDSRPKIHAPLARVVHNESAALSSVSSRTGVFIQGRSPLAARQTMADFRTAYSKLIQDLWSNPGKKDQIQQDPDLLKVYGFDTVPKSVAFTDAYSGATATGYDEQLKSWDHNKDGAITLFIPPEPTVTPGGTAGAAAKDVSVCCCCCPCCTCT